ncbi:MAG TPA: site-2 protease family protein [bacterium]|nr:site-2 protease family protein [bacterium]
MLSTILQNPAESFFYIIALVLAITIHEYAHAWASDYLGDPTPRQQGRLSINPLRHLDPLGTIFLFVAGFGWGKPVITDIRNFSNPKIGYAITSLAGPIANLIMAYIFSLPVTICIILKYNTNQIPFLTFTELAYSANVLLMVFNLLPIYPLDGSKLIMAFINNPTTMQNFMRYGPLVLIFLYLINQWIPIFSWTIVSLSVLTNFIIRGIFLQFF